MRGGVVDAAALDLDHREEAGLGAQAPVVLEARGLDALEGDLLQAQAARDLHRVGRQTLAVDDDAGCAHGRREGSPARGARQSLRRRPRDAARARVASAPCAAAPRSPGSRSSAPSCGAACRGDAQGAATIEFWAMGREGEVVRALVPAFEARHPGLRVRVQQVPWSAAHEKLLTAYVGGAMPDALPARQHLDPRARGARRARAARRADRGLARSRARTSSPGVLDAVVVDGATWALPWYADTRLLFYRSDLLAAAGRGEAPRTWAGVARRPGRAEGARGRRPATRCCCRSPSGSPVVILALQQGAELLRDGDRYGELREPRLPRAPSTFYLSFFRDGLAPAAGAAQLANLHQDFAAGWFAAFVSGPWQLGELRRRLPAEFEARWATAPLPGAAGATSSPAASAAPASRSRAARASPSCARSPRKDAAWRWLAFLAEPEQQIAFHRALGRPAGAPRSAWRDAACAAIAKARGLPARSSSTCARRRRSPSGSASRAAIARHAEAAVRGEETRRGGARGPRPRESTRCSRSGAGSSRGAGAGVGSSAPGRGIATKRA